jgi:hypothetical protein
VREALGRTGSNSTTIASMLKRWKIENQETVAATESRLPAELIDAVKSVHDRLQAGTAR